MTSHLSDSLFYPIFTELLYGTAGYQDTSHYTEVPARYSLHYMRASCACNLLLHTQYIKEEYEKEVHTNDTATGSTGKGIDLPVRSHMDSLQLTTQTISLLGFVELVGFAYGGQTSEREIVLELP